MDKGLVAEVRDVGCMPFEADTGLHEWYRQQGIDPSKLEVHNSPTNVKMPQYITERQEKIRESVLAMKKLEDEGKAGSDDYSRMETVVKLALGELKPFKVEGTAMWQIPQGMMDGSHYFLEPCPLGSGLYPLGAGIETFVGSAMSSCNAGHALTGVCGVNRDPIQRPKKHIES